eukprot:jgi/Picsp_1/2927/NSC_01152-R1_histone deacetylase
MPKGTIVYSVVTSTQHAHPRGHVERPERIDGIMKHIGAELKEDLYFREHVKEISSKRLVTTDEVGLVHSYLDTLRDSTRRLGSQDDDIAVLADEFDVDGCTYATRVSDTCALMATGTVLDLVDLVCSVESSSKSGGEMRNAPNERSKGEGQKQTCGFAIVRPPGHHATPSTPLGFCLLNNVSIAAKYAQQTYGIERVVIFDFDLHNGNGTAEIFWEDDSVMVIDMHEASSVYEPPEYVASDCTAIGSGKGSGFTVNIPLPAHAGHECAIYAFESIVEPMIRRMNPGLLIVSAGYDAHKEDPFRMLGFSDSTYHWFGSKLAALADELCTGRLVFVLEGGYNVEAIGRSVVQTMRGVLGMAETSGDDQPIQEEEDHCMSSTRGKEVEKIVSDLKQVHDISWS